MASSDQTNQDSSSAPSIPNLSGDNWGTWYSTIESYFLIKDLYSILDGSEEEPTEAVTLRAFYRRKKNSAGIIVRKISDLI